MYVNVKMYFIENTYLIKTELVYLCFENLFHSVAFHNVGLLSKC